MSDKNRMRRAWGNLPRRWTPEGDPDRNISSYPYRRSLVEETASINLGTMLQKYGKPKLLKAADVGAAVRVKLGGDSVNVYLTWTTHRLPGKTCRWTSVAQGNAQIWLVCMTCKCRVRALYRNPLPQVQGMPEIGCRRCLRLIYASENSGKRKWWREIVRPLRRLYLKREKLLALKRTPRIVEELRQIEELIFIYTQRTKTKRRGKPPSGVKRRYRDARLAFGLYPDSDPSLYL
jgi:hypothetical protein